ERRLPACIRRQLADEICVRQAAEHCRQAACAPQQNGGMPSARSISWQGPYSLIALLWTQRNVNLVSRSKFNRAGVTGIGVAQDAHCRIARQHALETACGVIVSIRNNDHAGVL